MNKLEQILNKWDMHIGDGVGDVCSGNDEKAMEDCVKELQNLIEEEKRKAVEEFADMLEHKGWGDMKVEIEQYLEENK